jgi:hypothetical protein
VLLRLWLAGEGIRATELLVDFDRETVAARPGCGFGVIPGRWSWQYGLTMPSTTKTPGRARKPSMTDSHKAALAVGREEGRAVKAYLEALDAIQPRRRGRKRTTESIEKRLMAVAAALPTAGALERLHLTQERADLQAELAAAANAEASDLTALRVRFVKVARAYGERKGISYKTWREVGIDAATLREAGIQRAS